MSAQDAGAVHYRRTPIEIESPEQLGYSTIENNLAESSFSDMCLGDYGVEADLGRMLLPYGDHLGAERLRALIAADSDTLSPDHVLVTAGAASALFIVATALLGANDHALICAPNYATNLETPASDRRGRRDLRASLRGRLAARPGEPRIADPARDAPDQRHVSAQPDRQHDHAGRAPRPRRTRREPPDGAPARRRDLPRVGLRRAAPDGGRPVAPRARRLVDVEDLRPARASDGVADVPRRTPDGDTPRCEGADLHLRGGRRGGDRRAGARAARPPCCARPRKTRKHLGVVRDWIDGARAVRVGRAEGGVVCFPRLRPEIDVDVDGFYRALLDEHGTYVGPGHWFDQDRRFFRLGFAWPGQEELERGLEGLDLAAASGRR